MLTVDFNRLDLKKGDRILDLGSGQGRHSWEAWKHEGVDVVAVEPDKNKACFARYMLDSMGENRESGGGQNLVVRADALCLPFEDNAFDKVVCSEVLEHIPDDAGAVAEIARVLKPGNNLAVSVPAFFPERLCWMITDQYCEMAEGHLRIYTREKILGLLTKAGLACYALDRAHSLHSPYWWLKCLAVRVKSARAVLGFYEKALNRQIAGQSGFMTGLDKLLAPVMAKSLVLYMRKEAVS